MKVGILAAIVIAAFGFGCAHGDKRITTFSGESAVFHSDKKGESLETKLLWVKNKPKAVDINMQITNNYKKPVILKVRNFDGEVGGSKAMSVMPDEYVKLAPEQTWVGVIALRFAVKNEQRSGQGKLTMPVNEQGLDIDGKALKAAVIEFPVNPVH